MKNHQSTNGNNQVNQARNTFNDNVSKLQILGSSKKVAWDSKRRHRSI
jgi:hypothetical protein